MGGGFAGGGGGYGGMVGGMAGGMTGGMVGGMGGGFPGGRGAGNGYGSPNVAFHKCLNVLVDYRALILVHYILEEHWQRPMILRLN